MPHRATQTDDVVVTQPPAPRPARPVARPTLCTQCARNAHRTCIRKMCRTCCHGVTPAADTACEPHRGDTSSPYCRMLRALRDEGEAAFPRYYAECFMDMLGCRSRQHHPRVAKSMPRAQAWLISWHRACMRQIYQCGRDHALWRCLASNEFDDAKRALRSDNYAGGFVARAAMQRMGIR